MIRETTLVLPSFLAAAAALVQQNVAAANSSARLEDNSHQTGSASERGSRKDAKLFAAFSKDCNNSSVREELL